MAALLCVLLSACISAESQQAIRLLRDIEVGAGPSELKQETPAPLRETLAITAESRRTAADLYRPTDDVRGSIVLVHGFTTEGKDDPRLVALAESLARVGFLVLTPDLPRSKQTRVSVSDAHRIADAAAFLNEGDFPDAAESAPGIFAVSYAVGLAVLATTDARIRQELGFLVSLGGYHDTLDVVRFITTGYHYDPVKDRWRQQRPNPLSKWIFLRANLGVLERDSDRRALDRIAARKLADEDADISALADRLGPEARAFLALLTNRDPDRVEDLAAALPAAARRQMERLSPSAYDLSHLHGKLILIHGREDRLIAYTQSLALDRAVKDSELFLIPGFSHIDPSDVGVLGRLALIDAAQAVLERRR